MVTPVVQYSRGGTCISNSSPPSPSQTCLYFIKAHFHIAFEFSIYHAVGKDALFRPKESKSCSSLVARTERNVELADLRLLWRVYFVALIIGFCRAWRVVRPLLGPPRTFRSNCKQMATVSTAQWDAELGVWMGERAPHHGDEALPDPLYILGYGSLIWRPGPLLERCQTFKCTALGSMRLFAQKSCDHRGTPEFPGLVLNLVNDTVLEERGYRSRELSQSQFRAMVWLVPPELKDEIIDDLDYRERGGYHRHLIPIKIDRGESGGAANEEQIVEALVYTGAPDNPNFHLPPLQRRLSAVLRANEAAEEDVHVEAHILPFRLHRRNVMTDTIAAAVGPSGPNVDYLCNLERYLNTHGMHDPFLSTLAASVRLRLGPWRGALYRSSDVLREESARQSAKQMASAVLPFQLVGWGANEFLQLSSQPPPAGSELAGETGLLACRVTATAISHCLPPPAVAGQPAAPADDSLVVGASTAGEGSETDDHGHARPDSGWQRMSEVEQRFVAAGGGTSAVVQRGAARVWGKLVPVLLQHLQSDTRISGSVPPSIVLEGVYGVAMGHDHMLLLHRRRVPLRAGSVAGDLADHWEDVVVAVGGDSHGQCSGAGRACRGVGIAVISLEDLKLVPTGQPGVFRIATRGGQEGVPGRQPGGLNGQGTGRVVKLAVGLRHSAMLTGTGALVTWGDSRHGQVLQSPAEGGSYGGAAAWRPSSGAKVVDVACGAKYTVLLDDLGVTYRLGGRQRGDAGASGGSGIPERVEGLPDGVRWQRVVSGWSHVVLRGLSADVDSRRLVFYAWGRQDMGQFPTVATEAEVGAGGTQPVPVELAPLPEGRQLVEVWCGSEYTLAADDDGGLWGCGWNEHGNLGVGCGGPVPSAGAWRRVTRRAERGDDSQTTEVDAPPLVLEHVWEGAVACGGGHVLCLPEW